MMVRDRIENVGVAKGGLVCLKRCFWSVWCWVILPAVLFSPTPSHTASTHETGDEGIASKIVVINGKGDGGIVADGQRYRVGESTVILDTEGNGISLCDLPLPCEADVEYRLTDEPEPFCLRIQTLRVLQAAHHFVIIDDPG